MNTLDKLRQIPDLAALVPLTEGVPYRRPPGPEKRSGSKMTSGPMPPQVAAKEYMLSSRGLMHELTMAIRMVWEQQEPPRKLLADTATFASECAWLIETADQWHADPVLLGWVRGKVNLVHAELAGWVGEQTPARLVCGCGGTVEVDDYSATGDGSRAAACSGCGKVWLPEDIATSAVMNTPVRLPEVARLVGVHIRKLQRWASAGLLKPVTSHSPAPNAPHLYVPADAQRLAAMVKPQREGTA